MEHQGEIRLSYKLFRPFLSKDTTIHIGFSFTWHMESIMTIFNPHIYIRQIYNFVVRIGKKNLNFLTTKYFTYYTNFKENFTVEHS